MSLMPGYQFMQPAQAVHQSDASTQWRATPPLDVSVMTTNATFMPSVSLTTTDPNRPPQAVTPSPKKLNYGDAAWSTYEPVMPVTGGHTIIVRGGGSTNNTLGTPNVQGPMMPTRQVTPSNWLSGVFLGG